ncbi:hypothetical protein B1218_34070, partial [Pseudomonas ogarae]
AVDRSARRPWGSGGWGDNEGGRKREAAAEMEWASGSGIHVMSGLLRQRVMLEKRKDRRSVPSIAAACLHSFGSALAHDGVRQPGLALAA